MSKPSPIDVRLAVVSAMLEPALALARIANLDLDDLRELAGVGYFRALQARGLSWEAAARRMNKSRRTVASLAKQASEREPLSGSERLQLRRRTVRVLAEGPATLPALAKAIPSADGDALREELAHLTDQGIVDGDIDGELRLASELLDLLGDGFDQKLASLRHFLEVIGHVVYRRFYRPSSKREAFARVLTFSARKERLGELAESIYEALEAAVFAADAEAEGDDDAVQASVAFCVVETPDDQHWR